VLKEDLREFSNLPSIRRHLVKDYSAGEAVPSGIYMDKPIDGNSGYGINKIEIKQGKKFVVPNMRIVQEYIKKKVFKYLVNTANIKVEIPTVIELRIMTMGSAKGNKTGYTFLARTSPRYTLPETKNFEKIEENNIGIPMENEAQGETKTNVLFTLIAKRQIRERFRKSGNKIEMHNEPWGMCPVLIEK
jgi:hypothetical protein